MNSLESDYQTGIQDNKSEDVPSFPCDNSNISVILTKQPPPQYLQSKKDVWTIGLG